jgi:protein disulfide-isomerase A1
MDNEDVGRPVSDYFGVSGDAPKVISFPFFL